MSELSTVRVTMANMLLQFTAAFGCISLVAAGSSSLTSVSNLHGGRYSYGVDHDSYGAWYGTSQPALYGGLTAGHGGLGVGHGLYDHGHALPHGDYGYSTYGAGYGHGDYATSYQNVNMKSYGGEKVLHAGHSVHHGHGASSYQKIVQKFGHSGLYDGLDSYAGGYGHGHYAGHGISQQNFNLKSYAHTPIHADPISYAPLHEISYTPHHESIPHITLHQEAIPHIPSLHETIPSLHESIPHIPPHHETIPHSYGYTLDDISSFYGPHSHGHESLNDFYGSGDYHNVLDYGHSHIHNTPYYSYGNTDSFGTYGDYGSNGYYGYGYYHR